MNRVLVDTGPLLAILLDTEQHHAACVRYFLDSGARLATCWPVLTEAAWLLQNRPDIFANLLATVEKRGLEILPLSADDVPYIATLMRRYRNLRLQLADAALVHLANRERIDTIFTLDRRDFSIVRGAHGKRFTLVP
ncbi:MAG TPA: PIN domain-containing protein [Bryobacteraceae bacterium]|nr:PIN domain-containing protein [Bryobacteraceae bacterium]